MRNGRRSTLALGIGLALLGATSHTSLATPVDPEILKQIGPRVSNPGLSKKALVEQGRTLFFEETFEGNGRTCGTCHPATNNFTIDPDFIADLPHDDPLFVDIPGLEHPDLLGKGLILENLDGFDRPGVMRGVPHNLAMPTSMKSGLAGIKEATGWSGDGSPDGTLRGFTVGAIFQHLPKTLARLPGVDFRLPTALELDAIEAFVRSVGRQGDVDLAAMTFADANVVRGKLLFNNEDEVDDRACSSCHMNAGANRGDGVNANFDTGTRLLAVGLPPDGGFAATPERSEGGFGDGKMNAPPLIEAADTGPFFHNNSAETLELAIAFYNSEQFAQSPAGGFGPPFDLSQDDIDDIGALLRTLNAMENIRYGNVVSEAAQRTVPPAAAMARIAEVVADTGEAIQVLTEGPLSLYPEGDLVEKLREAFALEQQARETIETPQRNALLGRAAALKREASAMMVE